MSWVTGPSSFCHQSSVSIGGRAGSRIHPLSATDLVCLSGKELDHCCGCSSSLSATDLMHLLGEELVHCCHHVLVQIQISMLVCVLSVQPLLSVLCRVQVCSTVRGMYKCGGFMLGEHRCLHSKRGRTSEQGRLRPRWCSALA